MADRFSKETAQQRTYRALEILLAGEDGEIDVAQAALLIASIAYPALDIDAYLLQLDVFARRVRSVLTLPPSDILPILPADVDPLNALDAMNQVLFDEEHFHGNDQDYYNPENSFLNRVLDTHTGIPVTLSLLYMEVGRRVGLSIEGVGFPGHFMVRCVLPQGPIYIDPYAEGLLLSEHDCIERIRHITQRRIKLHSHWFEPIGHKYLLVRILNNLKKIYIEQEDYTHASAICDLLVLLSPGSAFELRDRGYIHLQLKHYARALKDLTAYLEIAPNAEDRDDILHYIKTIRQIITMLN